jgi:hypothetical protein
MPSFYCAVNAVGPGADGTQTPDPVLYISLTDALGSFTNQWCYVAAGSQSLMLAVGLAAMNTNRQVQVEVDPTPPIFFGPLPSVTKMYLTLLSALLVGPLIALSGLWAVDGSPGPIISVNGDDLSIDMSAYNRPTATGAIVDRANITVNFPDSGAYRGQLQPPGTIVWSNGTSWVKD